MSSRSTAVRARAAKTASRKRSSKAISDKAVVTPAASVSAAALRLAAEVERGLAAGSVDVLSPQAVQALMAAACNVYSAQIEAGQQYVPLKPQSVPPTAVMATASGILKSANLAVFELGMWQSWTGR
jgi:hypothetical protein